MAISTAVPVGAIARAVGAEIKNVNLRTGAVTLPQQVAVLAQPSDGMSGIKYNERKTITGHAEAGAAFGFGSPIHLICKQLFPRANDGVTSAIPVNIYPLEASSSAIAATGGYEISGVATKNTTRTFDIANLSVSIGIRKGDDADDILTSVKNAIDSDINMPVNVETVNGVPATPSVLTGGASPDDPATLTASDYQILLSVDGVALTVDVDLSTSADALTISSTLQTAIVNAGGRVIVAWDDANSQYTITTEATGTESMITTVTDSGSGTTGLADALKLSSTTSAVVTDGVDEIPSQINLTAKWSGTTGNDINLGLSGDTGDGLLFAITDMNGGQLNPDIEPALDNFKNTWNTIVVNQFGFDVDVFDKLDFFNEGRWDGMIAKPFVAIYGATDKYRDDLIAHSVDRKEDRTNVCMPVYGSVSLPFEIAGRAAGMIASRASENVPRPYIGLRMTGIATSPEEFELGYTDRNTLEVNGISTTISDNGAPEIQDVVTFYRPDGVQDLGYKYIVDIMKSFDWLFNLKLRFNGPKWEAVILVNDDDVTHNPYARRPSNAVSEIYGLIDSFALDAIIVDKDFAKQNTRAEIDPDNPNRINTNTTVKYSGSGRISSHTLNFGFNVK